MSDDLVAFLLARLDEDEQTARLGEPAGPTLTWREVGDTGVIVATDGRRAEECANGNWAGVAAHIARHDPARVLAEVDAKRSILARYTSAVEDSAEDEDGYYDENRFEDARQLVPVLRLLALPYADHPEYRPEWAPKS